MGANGNMNCNIRRGTVFRQLAESRSFLLAGKKFYSGLPAVRF